MLNQTKHFVSWTLVPIDADSKNRSRYGYKLTIDVGCVVIQNPAEILTYRKYIYKIAF